MNEQEFAARYDYRPSVSMADIFAKAKAEVYLDYTPEAHAKLVRIHRAATEGYYDFNTQYGKE